MELGSVQKTLLLPLWGRAFETQKKEPLLTDKTAAEIIGRLDYDFSRIAANIGILTQLAWIARSLNFDRAIRRFLERHPRASIVNIGCGLDTTLGRVDNGTLTWYDLDLPDVISLRGRFITPTGRSRSIACSLLEDSWYGEVGGRDGILFLAGGVFYYFEEAQMRCFFSKLAERFPGSEVIFDAVSPFGVKVANKRVIEAGGMDEGSLLKWGMKRARSMQGWDRRIAIVGDYPLFSIIRRRLDGPNRVRTLISDLLRVMYMVHLRMEPS